MRFSKLREPTPSSTCVPADFRGGGEHRHTDAQVLEGVGSRGLEKRIKLLQDRDRGSRIAADDGQR